MPRNGSGTFNLVSGNPVTSGTTIQSSWANNTMSDIASALTGSLSRDGQAAMTGPLPMGAQDIQNAGTITANNNVNAAAFVPSGSSIPSNGMYLPAANKLGWSTNNGLRFSIDSTGVSTFAGNVTISSGGATITGAVSGDSFIPTSATVPANGLYLSSANTIALSSNTTARVTVNGTGNVVVNAPSSGTTLTISAVGGSNALQLTASAATQTGISLGQSGQTLWQIYQPASSNDLRFYDGSGDRFKIATGGVVTFTDGVVHQSGTNKLFATSGNTVYLYAGSTSGLQVRNATDASTLFQVANTGNVTINAPSSGAALTVNGVSGTHSTQIADSATNLYNAGYLGLPQSTNTTLALSDRGKHTLVTTNVTVPASTFAAGDAVTIVNNSGSAITVTFTSGTVYLAGTATTGTARTLAQRAVCTALCTASNTWYVSGAGVS